MIGTLAYSEVGCYIWYSEDRGFAVRRGPDWLLTVPNATTHSLRTEYQLCISVTSTCMKPMCEAIKQVFASEILMTYYIVADRNRIPCCDST